MAGADDLVYFFPTRVADPSERAGALSERVVQPPNTAAAADAGTKATSPVGWQTVPLRTEPKPRASLQAASHRHTNLLNPAVDDAGEHQAIELNAILPERFGRTPRATPAIHHSNVAGHQSAVNRQSNEVCKYVQAQRAPVEAQSWLSRPEYPTAHEIMDIPEDWQPRNSTGQPIIKPNREIGPWESEEDYLSTHYELLREDAVRPLREAVAFLRRYPGGSEGSKNNKGIGIYDRVHITTLTFSKRGLGIKVVFSLAKVGKNVKWDQSKRLITGSIVALSPKEDMFQTKAIVAVVAARPLSQLKESPPSVDLFFTDPNDIDIDPDAEYVMVEERSAFYEANRSTMLALQKMMKERFPLSNHLVHVEPDVDPPQYLLETAIQDLSTIFPGQHDVDILRDFPMDPAGTTLDESQLAALRRILTKSLALVQGPPGTGKTHVSVKAVKALVSNRTFKNPPIIIACQTNHALDQILRHIAPFEKEFARLGGRSKDTTGVITNRTLYNLKMQQHGIRGPFGRFADAALKSLATEMLEALKPLESGSNHLLDPKVFYEHRLLSEQQYLSLLNKQEKWTSRDDEDLPILQKWLGKLLLVNKRKYVVELFGYDYEDDEMPPELLEELEAENNPLDEDDDIERLKGPSVRLCDAFAAKEAYSLTAQNIQDILASQSNLWNIPAKHRGSVFMYLMRELKDRIRYTIRKKARFYYQKAIDFQTGRWEDDWHILRRQKVIGMTTTGLSKYRALVSALQPEIVLIEEAAETLEAPVTAACMESVNHLILVGDHKQLRPQCAVKDLEQNFALNISLFERLVNNDVEFSILQSQRRMIPEIRRILRPIYGDTIHDHPSVTDLAMRPPVPGMGGVNSFLFTHEWPEERNDQMSAYNEWEADMVVGFMDYLVKNGLERSQITVLTFYNGQRLTILKKLDRHPDLGTGGRKLFKVCTVDSYQGEENDVVLLSLVRSNSTGSIGFLNVDNRVCVALSRARRGFYIFGNAELLACESKIWAEVVSIMAGKKKDAPVIVKRRIGYHMRLRCENHGHLTYIEDPFQWQSINGGCKARCDGILGCGHTCPLRCHTLPHARVNCMQPCERQFDCGHRCSGICGTHVCSCTICIGGLNRQARPQLDGSTSVASSSRQLFEGARRTPVPNAIASQRSDEAVKWHAFAARAVQEDKQQRLLNRQRLRSREYQVREESPRPSIAQTPLEPTLILADHQPPQPSSRSATPPRGRTQRFTYSQRFIAAGTTSTQPPREATRSDGSKSNSRQAEQPPAEPAEPENLIDLN